MVPKMSRVKATGLMAKKSSKQPTSSRKATGRPFKPGQSGNPGGRPKRGWSWGDLLQKALELEAKDGRPQKEHVAEMMVEKALKGDARAFEVIADRMEGKPKQSVDMNIDQWPSLQGVDVE